MRLILISVKKRWADAILAGQKKVELRRTKPADADTNRLHDDCLFICYGGKVYGTCSCMGYQGVYYCEPSEERLAQACVTREEWMAYKPRFDWYLGAPCAFKMPVPLADVGIARSPQSWQYLTSEQAREILEKGGMPC